MTPFTIYWALSACISHGFNIILIYVIVSEPLDKMFGFRRYLLNFAISEFWFTFILAWGVKPEFFVPLPTMKMTGFFSFFQERGKWMAIYLMILPVVALCYSFVELCVMRSLILMGQSGRVRMFGGKARYFLLPFVYVTVSLVFLCSIYYFRLSKDGLKEFVKEHKLNETYSMINEQTDMLLSFNTFHPDLQLYSLGSGAVSLLMTPGLIMFIYIAYRMSDIQSNRNYSTENLKLQKNITCLLIILSIILQVFVAVPINGVIFVCSFYIPSETESELMKYIGTGLILLHPVFITIFTIWLMIPYRLYVRMMLYSALPKWCLPDTRTVVTPVRWQVNEQQVNFNHIRRISEVNAQRIRAATAPVRATYLRYQ